MRKMAAANSEMRSQRVSISCCWSEPVEESLVTAFARDESRVRLFWYDAWKVAGVRNPEWWLLCTRILVLGFICTQWAALLARGAASQSSPCLGRSHSKLAAVCFMVS